MNAPQYDTADDAGPVGEGLLYSTLRDEASALVPLFCPWENPEPWWSISSLGGISFAAERHELCVTSDGWQRRGLGQYHAFSLAELRTIAIGLLVYCAWVDLATVPPAERPRDLPRLPASPKLDTDTVLPEEMPVGEGPLYVALRDEANALVPFFCPWKSPQPFWNLGSLGEVGLDAQSGEHRLHVATWNWQRSGLGYRRSFALSDLRADGITLLVYCAWADREAASPTD